MAKRCRAILSLVLLLAALRATMNFSVPRLPRQKRGVWTLSQQAETHEPFNEEPGKPFSFFEMELPDWLMPSLGADVKTDSWENHSILDFSLDYHVLAGTLFGMALFYVGVFA
ncbi:unnamed protein product [Symbiodinium natans]|uniref:Uncharacterized protein n=1 Tax=Symbiodinium natans TaxID=878477 RepID=A0A812LR95_9DINO|nr:unnamed protein product [Symbiodinium natans]